MRHARFSHAPQMDANLVGLFSSHNTPPREMELRGSDEALIVLFLLLIRALLTRHRHCWSHILLRQCREV